MRDFTDTTTTQLKALVPNLKADAKALFTTNKEEAMRLFRLFQRIIREIHYREFHFAQIAHRFN